MVITYTSREERARGVGVVTTTSFEQDDPQLPTLGGSCTAGWV